MDGPPVVIVVDAERDDEERSMQWPSFESMSLGSVSDSSDSNDSFSVVQEVAARLPVLRRLLNEESPSLLLKIPNFFDQTCSSRKVRKILEKISDAEAYRLEKETQGQPRRI